MVDPLVLSARNVLSNLKNWEFDVLGQYKIDKTEADKIIAVMENYILMTSMDKEDVLQSVLPFEACGDYEISEKEVSSNAD